MPVVEDCGCITSDYGIIKICETHEDECWCDWLIPEQGNDKCVLCLMRE